MTVENLVERPDRLGANIGPIAVGFCKAHMSVVRALLTQVGFGADLDLTDEERMERMVSGKRDALTEVTQSMIFGVVTIMGPQTLGQYDGCPACVLENTLSRAVDEIAIARMGTN
jgi:hypothetical protein